MADFRSIKCAMWREDDWFLDLPTDARLFWIYLFSNPSASVAGIYKLSLRTMVNESGLPQDRIEQLLVEFAQAGKAHFSDGVLWVVKMREHQASTSPLVGKRIDRDVAAMPHDNPVYRMYAARYGIDTLSGDADTVSIPIRTDTDTDTIQRERDTRAHAHARDAGFAAVTRAYEQFFGIIGFTQGEQLKELLDLYEAPKVLEAMPLAQGKQAPIPYMRTVLQNWKNGNTATGKKKDNRSPLMENDPNATGVTITSIEL